MPEIVRWYLADMWFDRVVTLNHELEGLLDHWVSGMQEALGTVRPSWRLRRAILGKAGSCPEKLAFAMYDALSEVRLRSAWRRLVD